jgi:hypothetical protein
MSLLTLIIGIIIFFLVGALAFAIIEGSGGYMGDSSMVPGCLGIMVLVLTVIVVIGLATGQIGIWIR